MGGLDNPLETMLYYLTLYEFMSAIYTFPIILQAYMTSCKIFF